MEVYPNLIKMLCDTLAVPVTGAGVEREFNKSRRVINWTRSRLNPGTIKNVMMFVLVFAINCQVSENANTGPANSHTAVDAATTANTAGRTHAQCSLPLP